MNCKPRERSLPITCFPCLQLGRRVLILQGRAWPGQVANTIDGGRHLVIRSGCANSPMPPCKSTSRPHQSDTMETLFMSTLVTQQYGCTDAGDPVEIDFNRIPWIVEVGAGSTLEFQDLSLTNLATISKSGNGAFPQYLYVANLIMWPSITSKPGAVINMVNITTNFWSKTLFRNPDCKYTNLPARPASEQVRTSSCRKQPFEMSRSIHLFKQQLKPIFLP